MSDWLPLSRVALRPGQVDFTHAVQRWRAAFQARGDHRVALYFQDSHAFAAALFGAWHAGKTVVLPGDLQAATLQRLQGEVGSLASDTPQDALPAVQASPVATENVSGPEMRPLDPLATHLVIYTSGSSGEPCAIDKCLAQLDAEVAALEACLGPQITSASKAASAPNRVLTTVSHQHIYGLLFGVLWPLAAHRPFAGARLTYPEDIARCTAEGPCLLVSSPAHLGRLPEHLDWSGARDHLRAVFSSGGPLPLDAARQAQALLGRAPIEVFGSSETGGIAWRQRRLDDAAHHNAAHSERWTPLPGVMLDEQDGCLRVQSPHLPPQSGKAAEAAWFTTADRVAEMSPDGRFTLLGRADRIVKLEEKRVSLTAIEQCLMQSPWVSAARVLMLPGATRTELGAVVALNAAGHAALGTQGKLALNHALREHLLHVVERVALPRRWRYLNELPTNAQGKTTEALLMSLFSSPAAAPASLLPEARWIERAADQAQVELAITPDLAVLDGHFPVAAILPGVAQLDWAIAFGRQAFEIPPRFLRVDALKFQQPVRPGTTLRLALEWLPGKSSLHFAYTSAEGPHSSGRVMFASDAPTSHEAGHG